MQSGKLGAIKKNLILSFKTAAGEERKCQRKPNFKMDEGFLIEDFFLVSRLIYFPLLK